ncbi:hypothetical protein [Sphingomonas sp. SUN039]|uniref:hypothetical protein n=1 Tax=Sphingomonas sp. SUN039 TaxID=2937787 RepID=UPI002164C988|nr:hypothetical protein [Sphingomonas sp. SUN039]UVO53547.1 hypothetical protein M0209_05215 [Sphingomonas sp. SUN039]
MDESAARYYMIVTMRLLLLLSAFLTAMVGVGTPAAAAPRPACEVSATASVRVERQAPRLMSVSPRTFGASDRVNFGPLARHSAPVRTTPLYAGRLRV